MIYLRKIFQFMSLVNISLHFMFVTCRKGYLGLAWFISFGFKGLENLLIILCESVIKSNVMIAFIMDIKNDMFNFGWIMHFFDDVNVGWEEDFEFK